jgi:hypothetical protein
MKALARICGFGNAGKYAQYLTAPGTPCRNMLRLGLRAVIPATASEKRLWYEAIAPTTPTLGSRAQSENLANHPGARIIQYEFKKQHNSKSDFSIAVRYFPMS